MVVICPLDTSIYVDNISQLSTVKIKPIDQNFVNDKLWHIRRVQTLSIILRCARAGVHETKISVLQYCQKLKASNTLTFYVDRNID